MKGSTHIIIIFHHFELQTGNYQAFYSIMIFFIIKIVNAGFIINK